MSNIVNNAWTCILLMFAGIGALYVCQLIGWVGMIAPTPGM